MAVAFLRGDHLYKWERMAAAQALEVHRWNIKRADRTYRQSHKASAVEVSEREAAGEGKKP
jgi:hypothetical protein